MTTVISFEITSVGIVGKNTSNFIMHEIVDDSLQSKMTSETPIFKLNSYDENLPIFQIVLDFIDIFGGIY